MIEGRTINQISRNPRLNDGRPMSGIIDLTWNVVTFKRYLFSEEDPGDGSLYRKKDLIQFYADPGGLRTINAEDIVL
jgi:hypothetical protein